MLFHYAKWWMGFFFLCSPLISEEYKCFYDKEMKCVCGCGSLEHIICKHALNEKPSPQLNRPSLLHRLLIMFPFIYVGTQAQYSRLNVIKTPAIYKQTTYKPYKPFDDLMKTSEDGLNLNMNYFVIPVTCPDPRLLLAFCM